MSSQAVSSGELDEVIDDAKLFRNYEQAASAYYKEHGGLDDEAYWEQMTKKSGEVNTLSPSDQIIQGAQFYRTFREGVLMMGKMSKCGQCPDDHITIASAFVISEDGVCVTNYHVFKQRDPSVVEDYITLFVMDINQNIYPVVEVLAASKSNDLVMFRVDVQGEKLKPLSIGHDQLIGEPINLISHPDHKFYTYTQGHVTRKYFRPGTSSVRQSISAEFAHGSSGAPILDSCGNVVGVVAATQNVYYLPNNQGYQMTLKEIIPVSCLKELIN
ncbi:MAG: serine protease [Mangrovibacterium sp.]